MPSGAKKRKAAKKKKVHNSSTTNSHQGENDGGELSSPTSQDPSIVVENRDDDSSENKSKDANGEEGNIEIESGSKTKSSNGSSSSSSDSSDEDSHLEKKEVVLEPPVPETESLPEKITPKDEELEVSPIVDEVSKVYDETKNEERQESVPQIESLPEETPHKAEEVESSTIVEPVKVVDSPLQEVPKVYDETKNDEKERKELVVGETQTPEVVEEHKAVVSEISSKDDYPSSSVIESVSKDNGFIESPREQLELSTPPKDPISQVHVGDHANETDTVEHSDRQTEVSSPPIVEQKRTSWMNCCGIFELFSGSGR